jgi:hypothetical protein
MDDKPAPQTILSMSPADLERLIRRIVREELSRIARRTASDILGDSAQEGTQDAAEDEALLQEALRVLQRYGGQPEAWVSWEEFEAELDRAEASGELPD